LIALYEPSLTVQPFVLRPMNFHPRPRELEPDVAHWNRIPEYVSVAEEIIVLLYAFTPHAPSPATRDTVPGCTEREGW
jgi:hypothetical protein